MLTALAILLASSTPAADIRGRWDLKADGVVIFRLEITGAAKSPTATWDRPEHFLTDGESFSQISGAAIRRHASKVRSIDGDVELSFDDPRPGTIADVFRLHRIDTDHIKVTYGPLASASFDFVRPAPAPPPLGGWDSGRTYIPTVNRPTNPEMTAIFEADQADRRADSIDWSIVGPADEKRRARTQALLESGALQSGDDFYGAAFVFQHGGTPDDYLKAHLLATIAIARGKPGAAWIASATLDRYLHAIGKPQILGTQFERRGNAPVTQEPYDRTLVSDAMRKALHVPAISEQEAQRLRYEEAASPTKKPAG